MFDVRGILQLLGGGLLTDEPVLYPRYVYPSTIKDIPINRRCDRLHFLQAGAWHARNGVEVAHYIVNYADGEKRRIPVVFGEDLINWHDPPRELRRAVVAWKDVHDTGQPVHLYRTTWQNERPDVSIVSLDLVSANDRLLPLSDSSYHRAMSLITALPVETYLAKECTLNKSPRDHSTDSTVPAM